MRLVGCVFMIALLASPALAGTINVWVTPAYQAVPLSAGTAIVELRANIAEADAIIGFGMDLGIGGDANVSFAAGDVLIGPGFDAAAAPDGDGLAGLVWPPNVVFGSDVLLATITLSLNANGTSSLNPGDSLALGDLTEGFSTEYGFADVAYTGGTIVVPEPAALALLAVVGLLRRR